MLFTILVATGLMLGSLLSFGVATAFIMQLVVRLIRAGYGGLSVSRNVTIMMVILLITGAAHLIQIALWASAVLIVGEVSTFEQAFYYSAQNYTALGYGDMILSERWRLIGPLEAINGILFFGLSTGLMFAVMSHLFSNRLRFRLGHSSEERVPLPNPAPASVCVYAR